MVDVRSVDKNRDGERFFFESGGKNLYGHLHLPVQESRGIGWIFCDPFAEEKLWAHRILFNLARRLTAHGFPVLRFDYMGHGDSEGHFSEATLGSRIEDILSAMAVMKKRAEVEHIGLFGLRLGAALALKALQREGSAEAVILWAPVLKVKDYIYDCLRSNLATQMVAYQKVLETRDRLAERMLAGEAVNIDGYEVPGILYKEGEALTGEGLVPQNPCKSFVLDIVRRERPIGRDLQEFQEQWEGRGGTIQISQSVFDPFWTELRHYYPAAPELNEKTVAFTENMA
jgi:exosortase A-associated hydrolase 2